MGLGHGLRGTVIVATKYPRPTYHSREPKVSSLNGCTPRFASPPPATPCRGCSVRCPPGHPGRPVQRGKPVEGSGIPRRGVVDMSSLQSAPDHEREPGERIRDRMQDEKMKRKNLKEVATTRDESSGCLLWGGHISPNGYAKLGRFYAHRLAYENAFGPIGIGLHIDHVMDRGCKHRHCIEPTHLEAVTQKENNRRQPNVIKQLNTTHCPHGHSYDAQNTWIRKRGNGFKRECRKCHYIRVSNRKREIRNRLRLVAL